MTTGLTPDQEAIKESVKRICDRFDDDYWSRKDSDKEYPHEFYTAMAEGGWLGITHPEALGGAGLGVTEAAVMMHTVASSAGGYTAACTLHLNLFGPQAISVFGTEEQKERLLKPLIAGVDKSCFGVTEPDAGLDTTSIKTFANRVEGGYRVTGRKIWTSQAHVANKIILLVRTTPRDQCAKPHEGMTLFYTDLDRAKIDVHPIPKMGRNAIDSNAIFIDDYFVPEADRIGEEGQGFRYILHSLNAERILVGIEAVGLGQGALARAVAYAKERRVFGRPIGQNQGIQHPLAENWMALEAAYWMIMRAAALYDAGKTCGAEANAGKFLGARAAFDACTQAVITHGGMGYAREYQVERLLREAMLTRISPVTEQLIDSFIAERVLGLPKSY